MLYTLLLTCVLFSSFLAGTSPPGGAQVTATQVGNLYVHVVYPNDRAASFHLRVRLLSGAGSTPVAETFTDDRGVTQFLRVSVGEYHVVVTGEGIEESDSGQFEIDGRKASQDIFITVRPTRGGGSNQPAPGSPSVAVVDLNIPGNARKEFDKANQAMADQDWNKALQRLNKAITLYPRYALAYNNLGLVYGRMNDPTHEREALEKALGLNDHLVPAMVNLAKLSLREGNSTQAETLLENAVQAEPNNAEAMVLLAQAQLLNKHYDQAIVSAHRVHAMPHQNMAAAHYIAARAYEHENRLQDALAELQTFLSEEPSGARADRVRAEIAQIQQAQR
jgi:tetratricopeptide (TPR) repeat protein